MKIFKGKDIHWAGHPDWYYFVSKKDLYSLKGDYILNCYSLDNIEDKSILEEDYVIKPKYDYGGNGVILNATQKDIDSISDKSNYIIQQKVDYERIVHSFNRNFYTEFRLMFVWNEDINNFEFCFALGRLSNHKKINMKNINNEKDLGATLVFFKK